MKASLLHTSVLVSLIIIAVRGDTLQDFNPLKNLGFMRPDGWHQFSTIGALSASATDFKRGPVCRRVVVFLARGAILDHIVADCDSVKPSFGLYAVDSSLRYYSLASVRQESVDFVVVKVAADEKHCDKTVYTVGGHKDSVSPQVEGKEPQGRVKAKADQDCQDLLHFTFPPMALLSSSGETGKFVPEEWSIFNPWEPLGFVTREYKLENKCFRLVVVTSYGRPVDAVKVTCGPLEGVVVTEKSLHLGDAVVVTPDKDKTTFTIILNPRTDHCLKKTVSVASKDGSYTRSKISTVKLNQQSSECQDLMKGKIEEYPTDKNKIEDLRKKPINVKPFGLTNLDQYKATGERSDFNLAGEEGIMIEPYVKTDDNSRVNVLTLMVRGVPVRRVIAESGPIKRLVIRTGALYYDKEVALTKLYATGGFQVLKRKETNYCIRKLYSVKDYVDETPAREDKREVTILNDDDCKNLIEGTDLKSDEAKEFPGATDDAGVPKNLPAFNDDD